MDLPFALPTSVAGLTLATVYGEEGILGRLLMGLGVNVVYTRLGVAVAMIFVSFPFVVRTMQPVLQVRGYVRGHRPAVVLLSRYGWWLAENHPLRCAGATYCVVAVAVAVAAAGHLRLCGVLPWGCAL